MTRTLKITTSNAIQRPPLSGFKVWDLRSSRRNELPDRAMSILMRSGDDWPSEEELVELGDINLEFMGGERREQSRRVA